MNYQTIFRGEGATVYQGNALDYLKKIPTNSVNVVVTSSDYWRQLDHGPSQQIGMTPTPEQFIWNLCDVFDQCKRVLVEGGCLFQVMQDTQNNKSPIRKAGERRLSNNAKTSERRKLLLGYREKEPLDIPFRLSEELRRRGWIKRQTLIWDKGNGGDPTQSDSATVNHEWILYFFKYSRGGRPYANCNGFPSSLFRYAPWKDPLGVHPCPFPPGLASEIILACTEPGETVLDPFGGSGVVAGVSVRNGRKVITGDLVPEYCDRIVAEITGEIKSESGTQKSLLAM